jgi:hypothetical protein
MEGLDAPEVKRALRVIRRATRKIEQGRLKESAAVIMEGFGGIMLRKLMDNVRKQR